jgi:hypothetical protein
VIPRFLSQCSCSHGSTIVPRSYVSDNLLEYSSTAVRVSETESSTVLRYKYCTVVDCNATGVLLLFWYRWPVSFLLLRVAAWLTAAQIVALRDIDQRSDIIMPHGSWRIENGILPGSVIELKFEPWNNTNGHANVTSPRSPNRSIAKASARFLSTAETQRLANADFARSSSNWTAY